LLAQQPSPLAFGTTSNNNPYLDVDPTQTFQTVDGFGFTLSGGSASVIAGLAPAAEAALLQELYGNGPNDIGISFIRLSIGASDMSASTFTYDDLAQGQTDPNLASFSIAPEETALIPVLKAILAIQPSIEILATPWSPPVWMKSNGSFVGGSLLTQYYDAYARYFVAYVKAMKAAGIPIYAVTPQNEPLNPGNDPSMTMADTEEATFVGQNLGPAFQAAGLATKIIVYDHNCDQPDYPITVLGDSTAYPFIDGSAFHLYAGDISALTTVHDAYPAKDVYFTEQYTATTGSFSGDLDWHVKNVIIGSMQNWGRTALEWVLATDPSYGPHTPGGCTTCKGAVTIGSSVTRNVGYYIVAHASKFVPPGSVRIASTPTGSLNSAAFTTPAGQTVLIVENDGGDASFNVRVNGTWAPASLVGGAVATYVW
jgi:glucosylceramidase